MSKAFIEHYRGCKIWRWSDETEYRVNKDNKQLVQGITHSDAIKMVNEMTSSNLDRYDFNTPINIQ